MSRHTRHSTFLLVALAFSVAACASAPPQPVHRVAATPAPAVEPAASDDVPEPEPREPSALRIAVVSDLNGRYGSTEYGDDVHAAVERLIDLRPDVVISAGDMVAGQRGGLDYEGMWEAFHLAVSDPLAEAGIPFAVSPGNHDASAFPKFAEERDHYAAAWDARRPDVDYIDATHFPFRYAFTVDGVLFVALDLTMPGPIDSDQRSWLEDILASHAASARASIVFGHLPLYPFSGKKRREILADEALEDMLVQHGVDMFVSGHHQAYYPGHRGELRLVGTGCLGGGVRTLAGSDQGSAKTLIMLELDEFGLRETTALSGNRFDARVDHETLPLKVVANNPDHAILREDVGAPPWLMRRAEAMLAAGHSPDVHPVALLDEAGDWDDALGLDAPTLTAAAPAPDSDDDEAFDPGRPVGELALVDLTDAEMLALAGDATPDPTLVATVDERLRPAPASARTATAASALHTLASARALRASGSRSDRASADLRAANLGATPAARAGTTDSRTYAAGVHVAALVAASASDAHSSDIPADAERSGRGGGGVAIGGRASARITDLAATFSQLHLSRSRALAAPADASGDATDDGGRRDAPEAAPDREGTRAAVPDTSETDAEEDAPRLQLRTLERTPIQR